MKKLALTTLFLLCFSACYVHSKNDDSRGNSINNNSEPSANEGANDSLTEKLLEGFVKRIDCGAVCNNEFVYVDVHDRQACLNNCKGKSLVVKTFFKVTQKKLLTLQVLLTIL